MSQKKPKPIDLHYEPRDWQRECHASKTRFTVLALHRRAGKTELALMELIDEALRCPRELPLFVYLAPFLKQAKVIAWARLKQRLQPLIITGAAEVQESELTVKFKHNGATIRILGADNPDSMRGVRLDGAVIDEVAQIRPEVWEDIIQPALSDRKGWALFIGTPAGVNLFSELFFKAERDASGTWSAARYTVFDTDALDPGEVQRLRGDMPESSFAREYLCDFSAAGDDQLITLGEADTASQREYPLGEFSEQPMVFGVDPARFGDDRSVIVRRQGFQMFDPLVYQGLDNMEFAARIVSLMEQYRPHSVFIDSGGGAGVIDRIRQLGRDVIEVPFGGRATNPARFMNRRAEMWWEMREWIRGAGGIPDNRDLKQELATPLYWYDPQGRIVLEPKAQIKKRLQGGASPDIAEALALTFAHPVRAETPEEIFGIRTPRSRRKDYDPLERFDREVMGR